MSSFAVIVVFVFEIESHCVAQAGLGLLCLCLSIFPSAGLIDMHHYVLCQLNLSYFLIMCLYVSMCMWVQFLKETREGAGPPEAGVGVTGGCG